MRALLGALVDRDLARIPREPNLHDKRLLAAHAHENARSLADLGGPADGEEPAGGDLRARLLEEARRAERDEAVVLLVRRLERQALELPPRLIEPPAHSMPARDPFVEIGTEDPGPHAELNAALIVAETAAATAAEVSFDTKLELAALAAARLEETAAIEAMLAVPWGSEPVDVSAYDELMALPVADRLEQLLREGGGSGEDPAA